MKDEILLPSESSISRLRNGHSAHYDEKALSQMLKVHSAPQKYTQWILLVLAVLLVFSGLYWYSQHNVQQPDRKTRALQKIEQLLATIQAQPVDAWPNRDQPLPISATCWNFLHIALVDHSNHYTVTLVYDTRDDSNYHFNLDAVTVQIEFPDKQKRRLTVLDDGGFICWEPSH